MRMNTFTLKMNKFYYKVAKKLLTLEAYANIIKSIQRYIITVN